MMEVMEMHGLIASEFSMSVPDSEPVYHLQYLAQLAEKKRNDRLKAATEGRVYIG